MWYIDSTAGPWHLALQGMAQTLLLRVLSSSSFFMLEESLTPLAGSSLLLSSLELSDTNVHEPSIRSRLGATAPFCTVFVLKLLEESPTPPAGLVRALSLQCLQRREGDTRSRVSLDGFSRGFSVVLVQHGLSNRWTTR